jgi:hypothetical protein
MSGHIGDGKYIFAGEEFGSDWLDFTQIH